MRRSIEFEAHVSLVDAENLSRTANSFGARTRRVARRHSGVVTRPIVGSDPDYYSRMAHKAFREAVDSDPELSELMHTACDLSTEIARDTEAPYDVYGPSVVAAHEIPGVVDSIQEILGTKDLFIRLSGKRLVRARNISTFAIRVIEHSNRMSEDLPDLVKPGLYRGLSPHMEINTVKYWESLQSKLDNNVLTG